MSHMNLSTPLKSSSPFLNPVRLIALLHFANDFFSGMIGIIMASQADNLNLSESQIGLAPAIFLAVSLLQPLVGWIADRTRRPLIMIAGTLLTTLGMLICGIAPSYLVILIGAFIGGIGNATFHPTGLATTRIFGGSKSKGRSVALFMLGGNSGFGIGPFIAGFALKSFGPSGVLPFALLNFILVPMLLYRLHHFLQQADAPDITASLSRPTTSSTTTQPSYKHLLLPILLYLIIVLLRGALAQAFAIFLPTFYKEQGFDLDLAGFATSIFLIASAAGSYLGAALSDRFSRHWIVAIALFLLTPFSFLTLQAESLALIVLFNIFTGLLMNANWPVLLMLGQEIFPGGANGATGLAFGWGFVSNAAGSFFVGLLADAIGLQSALEWVALLPMVGAVLIFGIRPQPKDFT